jgi:hypothetical protein
LLHDVEEKNATLPSVEPIRPRIQRGIAPRNRRKWR